MKKIWIIVLVVLIVFSVGAEVMAQRLSVSGNASYWGNRLWVGVSARSQLTTNLTARASYYYSSPRHRVTGDVVYDIKVSDAFDPFVGLGAGYSTHNRALHFDILGGARFRLDNFRLSAEGVYSIFPTRPNTYGIKMGMGISL